MTKPYERYNTGEASQINLWTDTWEAQTFTVSIGHVITVIYLRCFRSPGSPGTITVSIRATDSDGHPTGGDLASGTFDGNIIATAYSGALVACRLTAGISLQPGNRYAIVVRALSGDVNNQFNWVRDVDPSGYSRGNIEESLDSGATWSAIAADDFLFEEWGDPVSTHVAIGGKVRAGVNVFRNS